MDSTEFENSRIISSNSDIQQLQGVLIRYCYTITESKWDAEDLAQDTFLKAMKSRKDFYNHANPTAFLLAIARNTHTDQMRKKQKLVKIMSKVWSDPIVEDKSIDVEFACQVLIKYLSPLQRTVFIFREIYGFKSSEVASLLKTTEGSVKAALHRARSSLETIKEIPETDIVIESNEPQKSFIKAFVLAFNLGEAHTLVHLAHNDLIDPLIAIGAVQNQMLRNYYTGVQNSRFSSNFQCAA